MVMTLEVDTASSENVKTSAQERADGLLREGKISIDQYKELLKSDAKFRVEEARFERDEAVLAYQQYVEERDQSAADDKGVEAQVSSGHMTQIRDVSRIAYVDLDDDESEEEESTEEEEAAAGGHQASRETPVLPESLPVSKIIGSSKGKAQLEEAAVVSSPKSVSPISKARDEFVSSTSRESSGMPQLVRCPSDGISSSRPRSSRVLSYFFRRSNSSKLGGGLRSEEKNQSEDQQTRGRSLVTMRHHSEKKVTKVTTSEDIKKHNNEPPVIVAKARTQVLVNQDGIKKVQPHFVPPRKSRRSRRTAERMSEQPFSPADFERLRRTAKGGFGIVYLVRKRVEPGAGDIFAMKVLRKSTVLNHGDAAKAKLERDVLRYVKHPFVARLRYAFQTETRLYFITDFYVGGTLTSMLKASTGSRRCRPKAATFYAAELAAALTHLHSKGIVHRDVKPSNILVDRDGHVVLIDFGIAGIIEPEQKQLVEQFVGTYVYMAPEMISKNTVHGAFCDWWALGVVIYELLFGMTPFDGGGMRQAFEKILRYEVTIPPPPPPPPATPENLLPPEQQLDQSQNPQLQDTNPKEAYLDKYTKTDLDDLVLGLLIKDFNKRLGDAEVLKHKVFSAIDLDDLQRLGIRPPHRPKLPKYLAFHANDGRLLCNEISEDLPELDDDGESELEGDDEANYAKQPKNEDAAAAAAAAAGGSKPGSRQPSPIKAALAQSTPQGAFKGFSYAGDIIDFIAPSTDPSSAGLSVSSAGGSGVCKSHQVAAFGPAARAAEEKNKNSAKMPFRNQKRR